jgi:hypothetical protein
MCDILDRSTWAGHRHHRINLIGIVETICALCGHPVDDAASC